MTNKTQEVLRHLQFKKSITSYEAFILYGSTRLSAIIFALRAKGHTIVDKWEEDIDRYGNKVRFVRYVYLGNDIKARIDELIAKIKAKR
jgi:hypothetical protein